MGPESLRVSDDGYGVAGFRIQEFRGKSGFRVQVSGSVFEVPAHLQPWREEVVFLAAGTPVQSFGPRV